MIVENQDGGKDRKGAICMKKKLLISGLLVSLLVLGLAFVSCSNGSTDDDVDSKWQGTYRENGGSSVTVNASSIYCVFRDGATMTIDKLSMGSGGKITYRGNDIGTWVYVRTEGTEFGIFIDIPDRGIWGGFGGFGVEGLVNEIVTQGANFDPRPSVSVNSTPYFYGPKE
jgi:hypothetical protein